MTNRRLVMVVLVLLLLTLAGAWALSQGAGWGALLMVAGVLFVIVSFHAALTVYVCQNCGEKFRVSTLMDFLTPNLITRKYLRCPHCRKWHWDAVAGS
jgi:DNA-directed RNA polymerase subunit RPC12/RpoP